MSILDKCEPRYIEEHDISVEWLPNTYHTVQEYNYWAGEPNPEAEVPKVRQTVLMECNHDVILKLHELFHEGDPRVLKALMLCHNADLKEFVVLGYDFARSRPTVTIYPE